MIREDLPTNENLNDSSAESGQTLVLMALLFVVLLLFVGLAVDVGFGFVRSSQFSRAVDAAVLAGVLDLTPGSNGTDPADIRASQFLAANGWPTPTLTLYESARSITVDGIPQYTITATWPVETYFMGLLGINGFPITNAATAAYYTNSELYIPTSFDDGIMSKANLFLIGEEGCSSLGDPVIPLNSGASLPNEDYPAYGGVYRYRISVPARYPLTTGQNIVRVEIFDADSRNLVERANNAGIEVTHSKAVGGYVEDMACVTAGWGDRCIVYTGETPNAAFQNPFWMWRVDTHYDSSCNLVNDGYGDTVTSFELYYKDEDGYRKTHATYTVDNDRDAAYTDLNWISPGTQGSIVPADIISDSFEISVNDIPQNDDGSYSIFLDVRAPAGSSMNGYDIWAGTPPSFYVSLGLAPLDPYVNARNLQLVENPVGYGSAGISIYSLGRLPLQYYPNNTLGENFDDVTIPLILLDIDLADQTVYGTAFDYDPNISDKTINFFVDTVSKEGYDTYLDLVNPDDVDNQCQPDEKLHLLKTTCSGGLDTNGTCHGEWLQPQAQLCIPSTDYFGGGILQATLEPDGDAFTWQFAVTSGEPFLTR